MRSGSLVALCLLAVQDLDGAGGAQTVCAEGEELFHIVHGGDAASSLDLAAACHALDHQLDVVEGCACGGEAGAGLDVVSACLADDVTHPALLVVGQQAGLDDDLQDLIAHSLLDGADVLAHGVVLAVLQAADVDDHIHLGCTVLDGGLGLKGLGSGVHRTQREADHTAHRDAACHVLDGLLHIAGVDADRGRVVCNGLVAQGLDLGPCGLRLEQGVIDVGQDLFSIHVFSS